MTVSKTRCAAKDTAHLLDQLARRERGRLIADLVHRLGPHRLELAEDVVQEAVLAAMAGWPFGGVPENPGAWLARVARNKAVDRLRREGRENPFEDNEAQPDAAANPEVAEIRIQDPELKLIFLCCHSALSQKDSLMLTLKIVSGFTARDIASVFLVPEAGVAQRLARAKRKLRSLQQDVVEAPSRFELARRQPAVMKIIYLMFSASYMPRSGDQLILEDVALEALRLARLIADERETGSGETQALAALLSFQCSRFKARLDKHDKLCLLKDQNRNLWDQRLIQEGMRYLVAAQKAKVITRYHLEAGIAAAHATALSWGAVNWSAICGLYDKLSDLTGSPVVALNACVAKAFAGAPQEALRALEDISKAGALTAYAPLYQARAEILLLLGRKTEAAEAFEQAQARSVSAPVDTHIKERLLSCL